MKHAVLLAAVALSTFAADYAGPRPSKSDMPYLLHASTLIPTDVTDAQQDSKKDNITYSVSGTAAQAKTPLAEPIFIIQTDKLTPESIELYKFDVKNGRREVTMSAKRTRNGPRPIRLSVTRLEKGLFKIEAAETLENGEYGLSPMSSNKVFCFSVY